MQHYDKFYSAVLSISTLILGSSHSLYLSEILAKSAKWCNFYIFLCLGIILWILTLKLVENYSKIFNSYFKNNIFLASQNLFWEKQFLTYTVTTWHYRNTVEPIFAVLQIISYWHIIDLQNIWNTFHHVIFHFSLFYCRVFIEIYKFHFYFLSTLLLIIWAEIFTKCSARVGLQHRYINFRIVTHREP